jgi:5-methyltetrahydropteroyltriglutamate--homocysteine methyltransferase
VEYDHAIRDIPPERMRMHVCWGNANAPHTGDVPLGDIIDVLFTARPAGLAFEAANPATSTSGPCSKTSSCPTARS